MKTLHLTLKKKWFDMIASGEKTEEYREIKPYWVHRLLYASRTNFKACDSVKLNNIDYAPYAQPLPFKVIHFKNGYSKNAPELAVEFLGITIGEGNIKWGAPAYGEVFIIKLGKIIAQTR